MRRNFERTTYKNYVIDYDNLNRLYVYNRDCRFSESDQLTRRYVSLADLVNSQIIDYQDLDQMRNQNDIRLKHVKRFIDSLDEYF